MSGQCLERKPFGGSRGPGGVILALHHHTRYSPDSKVDPIALVRLAQSIGLHGIAITDHNAVGGIRGAAGAAGSFPDFVVIPATEVSTARGHILASAVRTTIPRDLTPVETVEQIVAEGGGPVAAPPYR